MSSASNHLPPNASDEYTASREDFELFRRLLRVARHLKDHDIDDPNYQELSLTQSTWEGGAAGTFSGPSINGSTSRSTGHLPVAENDYEYSNEFDDDEDDDDDGDETESGSGNAAASFNPSGETSNRGAELLQRQPNISTAGQQPPQSRQQRNRQQQQHAAVEKRYRSVVNSKIQQLNTLIPASNTFTRCEVNAPGKDQGSWAAQEVPTKSVVLDRAIQYVNHLVSTYQQYEAERDELSRLLRFWLDDITSAEKLKNAHV